MMLQLLGRMFIWAPPLPPEGIDTNSSHRSRKIVEDRLSKIEGHVHGIRKMVEEDRGCSDLLIQIAAVRSALDKVARIILEDHIETCLVEAIRSGKANASLTELKEALSKLF